jgi:DNA polymerase
MEEPLWVDFETRSMVSLSERGVYTYAKNAEVLCMAYAFGNKQVNLWVPRDGFPQSVREWRGEIRAHNAAFERLIFKYALNIEFNVNQFYCTAAQARANGMPGSLEQVGFFMGHPKRKHAGGKLLIKTLCVPHDGVFNNDEGKLKELYNYCMQDLRVMRNVSNDMRSLSKEELADYHVNERINDRGLRIDVVLARSAGPYAEQEVCEVCKKLELLTLGECKTPRGTKLTAWVAERLCPQDRALMTNESGKLTLDKAARGGLLESPGVPNDVRTAITYAEDIRSSSVHKFISMSNRADDVDQRLRGAFVFNGAPATGRLSSYGAQVHNFPRKCAADVEGTRNAIINRTIKGSVMDTLRSMLRPCIQAAPGRSFVIADWSSIEACVNPWLSGDKSADDLLSVFRRGEDPYVFLAKKMFPGEITPELRQAGKVSFLACMYGGAVGAFLNMEKAYGLKLDPATRTRNVELWRSVNVWATSLWRKLKHAYTSAMVHPGSIFTAGRVSYFFDKTHLWSLLPSGRVLCYPYARLDGDGVTYAKASWKPKADAKEWPRGRLWHGLACENNTQAVANDLLRHALRKLPNVVGTVHDEIILEVPDDQVGMFKKVIEDVMTTGPSWGQDIPLAVKVNVGKRFIKH